MSGSIESEILNKSSGGGGGMAVGGAITGGTNGLALYESGGLLAQSPSFRFDGMSLGLGSGGLGIGGTAQFTPNFYVDLRGTNANTDFPAIQFTTDGSGHASANGALIDYAGNDLNIRNRNGNVHVVTSATTFDITQSGTLSFSVNSGGTLTTIGNVAASDYIYLAQGSIQMYLRGMVAPLNEDTENWGVNSGGTRAIHGIVVNRQFMGFASGTLVPAVATGTIIVQAGNPLTLNADSVISTSSFKALSFYSREAGGGADFSGGGTLVGGTVTITTSACSASSRIFIQDTTSGSLTNVGTLTAVAGSGSFVVKSTSVLDTSTFNWWILTPF